MTPNPLKFPSNSPRTTYFVSFLHQIVSFLQERHRACALAVLHLPRFPCYCEKVNGFPDSLLQKRHSLAGYPRSTSNSTRDLGSHRLLDYPL